MTATEFLTQLDAALLGLTRDERESALEYYREYLADAGENADAAAESLGSPQSVAERIIAEADGSAEPGLSANAPYMDPAAAGAAFQDASYTGASYADPSYMDMPYNSPRSSSPDGAHIITLIVVLILTLPIWITVFSIWLSMVVSLACLLIGFGAGGIVGPIVGIMQLASGSVGSGLYILGSGLLCIGLTMLLWKPFWLVCKYATVGLFALSKSIIFGLLGRKES